MLIVNPIGAAAWGLLGVKMNSIANKAENEKKTGSVLAHVGVFTLHRIVVERSGSAFFDCRCA
jgi:hypothetical protein